LSTGATTSSAARRATGLPLSMLRIEQVGAELGEGVVGTAVGAVGTAMGLVWPATLMWAERSAVPSTADALTRPLRVNMTATARTARMAATRSDLQTVSGYGRRRAPQPTVAEMEWGWRARVRPIRLIWRGWSSFTTMYCVPILCPVTGTSGMSEAFSEIGPQASDGFKWEGSGPSGSGAVQTRSSLFAGWRPTVRF
jgi:hypothetical protein